MVERSAHPSEGASRLAKPIKHLRWYTGGLLFPSTVVNYIDRQTLGVLAPYIKTEFQWTNSYFGSRQSDPFAGNARGSPVGAKQARH